MNAKDLARRSRVSWVVVGAWLGLAVVAQAAESWQRQEVDWRAGGGRRIRGIYYPQARTPGSSEAQRTSVAPPVLRSRATLDAQLADTVADVNGLRIDSPPIAGFVPRIAVSITNERSDDFDWVAATEYSVTGRYLTSNPQSDFVIGLFDTGASTHILSYAGAQRTGVYAADLVTSSIVELLGATSSAYGWVSYPLAIFMDGLAAVDPNTQTLGPSFMVGQSNVSVIIGDEPMPGQPDLPTVVGSPMSVYFATVINNDANVVVTHDGNDYSSPDIRFYDLDDLDVPQYANSIPLNLLPAGGVNVQYIVDYEAIFDFVFRPGTPSIIVGNSAQSLFFVDSVDLYDGDQSAIDRSRFMLDTGAQITVIGSGVASRLGLNPAEPDFEVEIEDVTGTITMTPGFYLDMLEIPALGDWPSYSNVPVVMLDVASPEGGYLQGIIGTNLFTEFNLVLRGGGLSGQDPPSLEFQRIEVLEEVD
jgi:hypothetical protein